ncbi:MAG: YfiR family protein [Betaproteobacteria bacterium]|nr:YfiR family protein [Betaproteobacteria bacterium]
MGALRAFTAAVLALVFALNVFGIPDARAQAETDRALEQRVKAAFLYRFADFVIWPDTAFAKPDSPFVIAVAGADGVADHLRTITAGRSVGGRPIEIRRVGASDPVPTAQILFISGSDRARLREHLRAAPRYSLVVSEVEGALEQGSVINFVIAEDRVRFEISLESAEKRGLRLSSRLLAVARNVRGSP